MMKTIDHRILIPSTPERIWGIVSDLSRNPDWQVACREVIFLTSKRSGAGLRWRFSDDRRRDFVCEVSAWYAGLGYEYYFVDGALFRDARGRLRLQEAAEGTVVQWTFSYEPAGLLGGMIDTLGLHHSLDQNIQESLRQLWNITKPAKAELSQAPSKALMRDAPDVSARSAYQPRPPVREPEAPTTTQRATSAPPTWQRSLPPAPPTPPTPPPLEPSAQFGDTRPNPAAAVSSRLDAASLDDLLGADREPEFLSRLAALARFEPPAPAESTQPSQAQRGGFAEVDSFGPPEATPQRVAEPTAPTPPSVPKVVLAEPEPVAAAPTPPSVPKVVLAEPEPVAAAPTPPSVPKVVLAEPEPVAAAPTPTASATPAEPPPIPSSQIEDTRSIWEIFNVPRPSEVEKLATAELSVVAAEAEPPTSEPSLPVLTDAIGDKVALTSGTRGLRQAIRHRAVRIRRPY